jgi:hypothetical protein
MLDFLVRSCYHGTLDCYFWALFLALLRLFPDRLSTVAGNQKAGKIAKK